MLSVKKLYLKSDLLHDVFWVYLDNSTVRMTAVVIQFYIIVHSPLLSIIYFHSLMSM